MAGFLVNCLLNVEASAMHLSLAPVEKGFVCLAVACYVIYGATAMVPVNMNSRRGLCTKKIFSLKI